LAIGLAFALLPAFARRFAARYRKLGIADHPSGRDATVCIARENCPHFQLANQGVDSLPICQDEPRDLTRLGLTGTARRQHQMADRVAVRHDAEHPHPEPLRGE
jgi:hypothetical protein